MRRTSRRIPAAAALAALAALGAAPAARAQQPQEARLRVTTAAPERFWATLGDTTLARLAQEAASGNRDLAAAAARVDEARAGRLGAALDLAPTVTVNGGYTRQRLSVATVPGATGTLPGQDLWFAGVEASWELDVFGRVRRGVRGRGALIGAAEADARDVQVLVTAELAQAYMELRGAQGRLAVARRNAENQRRTLDMTRQRLDAGRGTALDTERAQAQLSTTLAAIPLLEAQAAAARHRIAVLLGRAPRALAAELAIDSADTTGPALPALPAPPALDSAEPLVRMRPDVVAAERVLAAENAFVGAAKAEYLPRITLAGGAGYTSNDFDQLGGTGMSRYAFGPVISWPALNLGRVKAAADEASARRDEARARYEQATLRAEEEIETAQVRYATARDRLARLEEAASASGRAANLARLRFEGGAADFLQVLDAERTQLAAQDQLAQGRTEAATALVALYRALGGRWPGAGQ
jgi:NodT family efflux transporter outer membrane factor (OMF) lipoprotein